MYLLRFQGRKWQRLLSHEREQRLRLEEMVEQLAKQHSRLENQCKNKNTQNSSEVRILQELYYS